MAQCPHCKGTLNVGQTPFLWLERYGNNCVATTECCGHAVKIRTRVSHEITAYTGDRTEDDWGAEIKPLEKDNTDELVQNVLDSVEAKMYFNAGKIILSAKTEKQRDRVLGLVLAASTDPEVILKIITGYNSAKGESDAN